MAHKLLEESLNETKPTIKTWLRTAVRGFTLPTGKFGLSLFIGKKEVFIGFAIGQVEMERIIRKRFIPLTKAQVKVFKFDSI